MEKWIDRCLDECKFCLLDMKKNTSELSVKEIGHVRIGAFATPSISQAKKVQQTAIHVHKDGRSTIPYRRATHQATGLNTSFHVRIYNVYHDDLRTFFPNLLTSNSSIKSLESNIACPFCQELLHMSCTCLASLAASGLHVQEGQISLHNLSL